MPASPITAYVAACDVCQIVFRDLTGVQLWFRDPAADPGMRRELADAGWLLTPTGRVLCDEHAPGWVEEQAEQLALAATHDPLF